MSEAPLTQSQKARQIMQDKAAKQSGNMLSALVIGLGVAGVVSAALVMTWAITHKDEIALDRSYSDSPATVHEKAH